MSDVAAIDSLVKKFEDLKAEIANVIIGQEQAVNYVLLAIFCGGHSLLIGVPGLAKTLLVHTVSDALGLNFKRIQFTPDLMPSDILGSEILNKEREFTFLKGPIFSNIILADEINRTPPKTQAALLEAMQEKSITIAGHHYKLDLPFLVLATQNPIEQKEEVEVVKNTTTDIISKASSLLSAKEIIEIQHLIRRVPVATNVIEYAVSLVAKTRPNSDQATDSVNRYVDWGAGPRASQNLILGAKAMAAVRGKYSPDIEDVQAVAIPILSHRIVKNYKAEAENISVAEIIKSLL